MFKPIQTPLIPLYNLRRRWSFGVGVFLLTLVSGIFITALLPVQYRAQAIIKIDPIHHAKDDIEHIPSDMQYPREVPASQISILRNDTLFKQIIETLNLTEKQEFNHALNLHRGLTDKIIEGLFTFKNDRKSEASLPLEEQIIHQLNTELSIIFDDNYRMEINYSSASPHLARAIANIITDHYMQINDDNMTKTLIKKADLPENIATPDIKASLYFIVIMGIILGFLACMYIVPKENSEGHRQ